MLPIWNAQTPSSRTSGFSPLDLPEHPRPKRSRSFNTDADLELDSYFRTKRFMTDTVTKEMDDIRITQNTIPTSPSRTSALSRLAQRGPALSGSTREMEQPPLSPRSLNSSGSWRRRSLIVTSAQDVNNSIAVDQDLSIDDGEDEEGGRSRQDEALPVLEWRSPIKPIVPPVEATLRRLIERRRENESKALVLYKSPTDIIKDVAQQALLDKIRSKPPTAMKTSPSGSPYPILAPEPIVPSNVIIHEPPYIKESSSMRVSPTDLSMYTYPTSNETSPPPKFSLFSQPLQPPSYEITMDQHTPSPLPMDLSMTPPVGPNNTHDNTMMEL